MPLDVCRTCGRSIKSDAIECPTCRALHAGDEPPFDCFDWPATALSHAIAVLLIVLCLVWALTGWGS